MNRNRTCNLCELGKMRQGRTCMPGYGNGPVMVIGESPNFKDDAADRPFAEKQIMDLFVEAGLTSQNTYFTYAVKCRTASMGQGKLRKITKSQKKACHPYLYQEALEIKPKLTICLGAEVAEKVFPGIPLGQLRGKYKPSKAFGILAFTYNPKFIFINNSYKELFIKDIKDALQYLKTGEVKIGREYGEGIIVNSTDEEEIGRCFREAVHGGFVASDLETPGLEYWNPGFQPFCYGACWGPGRGINFDPRRFPEQYARFLTLPQVVHNASFEGAIWGESHEVIVANNVLSLGSWIPLLADTMIQGHLRNPFFRQALEEQSKIYLDASPWKGGEATETDWFRRNAIDVETTWELYQSHMQALNDKEKMIHDEIILPCAPIYGRLQARGLTLDPQNQAALEKELICEAEKYRRILVAAGFPTDGNASSNQQIRQFLYKDCGIPVPPGALAEDAKSDLDGSTAAEFLAELALDYPICQTVRDYRHAEKLRTNYLYRNDDGSFRTHLRPKFKITGAVTGRPSSQDPPGQTFSREKRVRKNYIASSPDRVLISGDLKQVELVVMARLSGDPTMREIYLTGGDIHKMTCAEVVRAEMNSTNRSKAKACNFSLQYGASAQKFRMLILKDFLMNVSLVEARALKNGWFRLYAGVADYHKKIYKHVLFNPTITCPIGRSWNLGIATENKSIEDNWRKALNYPVQGVGALLCFLGLQELERIAPDSSILTIHDSVVGDVPREDAEEICRAWKTNWERRIQEVYPHEIPITVDMQSGRSLGELESYKWS